MEWQWRRQGKECNPITADSPWPLRTGDQKKRTGHLVCGSSGFYWRFSTSCCQYKYVHECLRASSLSLFPFCKWPHNGTMSWMPYFLFFPMKCTMNVQYTFPPCASFIFLKKRVVMSVSLFGLSGFRNAAWKLLCVYCLRKGPKCSRVYSDLFWVNSIQQHRENLSK